MLQKRKKTYLTIMMLGAVALMADRFLLPKAGVPESAFAQDDPSAMPSGAGSVPTPTGESIPELPFPRLPESYVLGNSVRDLFAPPHESADLLTGTDNATATQPARHAIFAQTHFLQAVLIQGQVRCAVINKKVVKADDSLGGCTIIEIGAREVTARCPDGEVTLHLPAPAAARQF